MGAAEPWVPTNRGRRRALSNQDSDVEPGVGIGSMSVLWFVVLLARRRADARRDASRREMPSPSDSQVRSGRVTEKFWLTHDLTQVKIFQKS